MFPPRPFLIALQFLTVLPIRLDAMPDSAANGRSVLYYPLVGLLIGLLLAALGWFGSGLPASIHAAVMLAFWVALTGALHLDGLADSADAWVGGFSDREKTLAIMKDVYCGPAAVVTLVLLLLLKFTALEQLIATGNWLTLVMIPVIGRALLLLLFLTTPYSRPNGLGSLLVSHMPRRACIAVILFTAIAIPIFIGITAIWLLLTVAAVFIALRTLMLKRIGGTTGDTAGALLEISETAMLIGASL